MLKKKDWRNIGIISKPDTQPFWRQSVWWDNAGRRSKSKQGPCKSLPVCQGSLWATKIWQTGICQWGSRNLLEGYIEWCRCDHAGSQWGYKRKTALNYLSHNEPPDHGRNQGLFETLPKLMCAWAHWCPLCCIQELPLVESLSTLIVASSIANKDHCEWIANSSISQLYPKGKRGKMLCHFRQILLLNVKGMILFVIMANQLNTCLTRNEYINTAVQKGGVKLMSGCVKHTAAIWDAVKESRKSRSNVSVIWLYLANVCGAIPHPLIRKVLTLDALKCVSWLKTLQCHESIWGLV